MKKYLLIAATACVALAACTKNEVKSVVADQEITFQTISTKATEAYSTSNVFKTWAYMHFEPYALPLPPQPQLYIGGANGLEISYFSETSQWKNATPYYWPKNDNKLTFFSYATNSDHCVLTNANVKCDFEKGVTVTGFTTADNLNVDLLVADVAKDQVANTDPSTYYFVGVPTLFRHKLSNVIFTINTKETYANKTFKLQTISFSSVATAGNYTQNPLATEEWEVTASGHTVYCNAVTEFGQTVVIPDATQSYYIPQGFSNDNKVAISYQIITNNGESDPTKYAVETVSVEKKLSELFPENWKIGHRYTCAITVSLDEILWDPAVETWEDKYYPLGI